MALGEAVQSPHHQPLTDAIPGLADTPDLGMEGAGDKMATNAGFHSANRSKTKRSKRHKKQGPFLKVKAGSAVVPIYRSESGKRVRFTLSFYQDGRRVRKMFSDLDEATD